MLPYGLALPLWIACGLAAWSFAVSGQLVPTDRGAAKLVAIATLCPAALFTLATGQASLLLAGLLVGGFRLLGHRPLLAGVLFGLLTMKPQLGLLIPLMLLIRGQWLAIASAATTAALLLILSLALFGLGPWQDYLANTVPYQHRILTEPFGLVWALLTTPYAFLVQIGFGVVAAKVLHVTIACGLLVLAIAAIVRSRTVASDCVVVAFTAVLLSPYILAYDLCIPTAALFWWLSERKSPVGRLDLGLLALFLMLPVVMMPLNVDGIPIMPPVVLALSVVVAVRIIREGRLDLGPTAARWTGHAAQLLHGAARGEGSRDAARVPDAR